MPESFRSRLNRWRFNWYPAFRRTGARITYLSADFHEIHAELPLTWKTRNIHGTIFGGAIYAMADPVHAVILAYHLGQGYAVWMKEAHIRFLRQGRDTLSLRARIEPGEIARVRAAVEAEGRTDETFFAVLRDPAGATCAEVRVVIHVRRAGSGQRTSLPFHQQNRTPPQTTHAQD